MKKTKKWTVWDIKNRALRFPIVVVVLIALVISCAALLIAGAIIGAVKGVASEVSDTWTSAQWFSIFKMTFRAFGNPTKEPTH